MNDLERIFYSEVDLDELGLLSRKTRYRLRREGRFPEPKQIGGRRLYLVTEILEFAQDPTAWVEEHEKRKVA